MSLINSVKSAVQNVVNTAVEQTQDAVATVTGAVQDAPRPSAPRDTFAQLSRPKLDLGASPVAVSARLDGGGLHASIDAGSQNFGSFSASLLGVTVSDGRNTVGFTAKDGYLASTHVLGEKVTVSFKADGPATLGAVDVKAGGQEVQGGIVPMAPSPLPMLIYAGKERK